MRPAPDLVIAGNLLIDDIVLPDGRTLMGEPGGAALYAALAASLWDITVGVVSVRGDDYPRHAIDALIRRGVDLSAVQPLHGPNLRTWLLYEPQGRRVLHHLGTPDHVRMSPHFAHFPEFYRDARAVHLAPMPFALQQELARAMRRWNPRLHLAVDPFEIVRAENVSQWYELLAQVQTWFVSEDDIAAQSDSESIALLSRAGYTLDGLVVRRLGARGGDVLDPGERFRPAHAWTPCEAKVVDTTGAGDAFAAGYLAGRVKNESLGTCCAMGAVSASFAIEGLGPRGLLWASPGEAQARLDRFMERGRFG